MATRCPTCRAPVTFRSFCGGPSYDDALVQELLALAKEARDGLAGELQAHYDIATDAAGNYTDPEDAEIETEIRQVIARFDAVIAKAEKPPSVVGGPR